MNNKCGADRVIGLEIGGGDNGGDIDISTVNGVPLARVHRTDHWIGGSGYYLINKCKRCAENPERECDLNTTNWKNLEPQKN